MQEFFAVSERMTETRTTICTFQTSIIPPSASYRHAWTCPPRTRNHTLFFAGDDKTNNRPRPLTTRKPRPTTLCERGWRWRSHPAEPPVTPANHRCVTKFAGRTYPSCQKDPPLPSLVFLEIVIFGFWKAGKLPLSSLIISCSQ